MQFTIKQQLNDKCFSIEVLEYHTVDEKTRARETNNNNILISLFCNPNKGPYKTLVGQVAIEYDQTTKEIITKTDTKKTEQSP